MCVCEREREKTFRLKAAEERQDSIDTSLPCGPASGEKLARGSEGVR
jgi:hypothetical protein